MNPRLLAKYIAHVSLHEGTDFLGYRDAWWTDAEWAMLQACSELAETLVLVEDTGLGRVLSASAEPPATREGAGDQAGSGSATS